MTAIVSTYVPEQGFVIGSDTLRTDAKTGGIITNNARKIFSIEDDLIRLAYAWAGASSLFYGCGQEFSFLDESEDIGKGIATNESTSIEEYTNQFARNMYERLQSICLPDGRLSDDPNVLQLEEIAHVLLVGYYTGKPYRTGIRFSHKNLKLQSPFRDEIIESPDTFDVLSGSSLVLKQFQPMMPPKTLEGAAELIRRYIQACIDNQNTYSDCKTIGGRVCIATITVEGFRWTIPPLATMV